MTCPYCNSKETISIIYLYRYNDNNTFVKKNNEEVKYSEKIRKPKRKNYDGTLITDHNHNKYCKKCNKSFNSIENLYAVDISKVTLVFILNKLRYKFEFIFSDETTFIIKRNYELVNQEILSNKEKVKILDSITNSKINFWNKEYINKDYDNYKWILKLEYYNGLSECFNGHDMIPSNWDMFIDGFRNLIKKYDKDNFLSKIKNSNIVHN